MEESIIKGYIKNYIFTSSDSLYKVASIETLDKMELTIVGYFPLLQEDLIYEFKGVMSNHTKYGTQLKIESFKNADVNTKEGVVSYLSSDRFKGIGEKTAVRIYEALGEDCLKIIMNSVDELVQTKILSLVKSHKLREQLLENKESEEVFVELFNYGLTPKMVSKLYEKYEHLAMKKVLENPYRLIYEVEGFGFKKSDTLAIKMGFKYNDENRLSEGIIFALNYVCNDKGFTFLTDTQLINSSLPLLNANIENENEQISDSLAKEILAKLIAAKRLIAEENRVYVNYLYEAEVKCANKLLLINETKFEKFAKEKMTELLTTVEQALNISYTPLQRDAIFGAIDNKITIITGGPGTGKTTIIKGILYLYSYLQNLDVDSDKISSQVLLVAPTGRASKRMSEATGFKASTIHKALGYNYEGFFTYDASNLLPYRLIIVDESSMLDIKLANALFEAISLGAKVILVGDENQLPSVSPGAVLHDMINSNAFKVERLNKIMRQAEGSNIIKLAMDINNERVNYDVFAAKNQTFFYDADSKDALQTIESLIKLFISKGGNLQSELQILAPMYNGVCGIDNLNKMVQEKFNNSKINIVRTNKFFLVGDKVLQLQNDPILNIMNGDIGIIKEIKKDDDKDFLTIDFDGFMVNYPANNLDNLTLAYAISIHKSQGSEYPNVIMPVLPSYYIMLKRKILYTAVTRAKSKLIIVGKYQSFLGGVNSRDDLRQTSLTRRLIKNLEINQNKENTIYINNKEIPFDTLGEFNMENITPYSFM